MLAFRISWMEYEQEDGATPDGYSLHTTTDAAADYMRANRQRYLASKATSYEFPEDSHGQIARAALVDVPDGSALANELAQQESLRFFKSDARESEVAQLRSPVEGKKSIDFSGTVAEAAARMKAGESAAYRRELLAMPGPG